MDFVHDQLATGHKIRVLTMVGILTQFALVIEPRFNFRAADVVEVLKRVGCEHGNPKAIRIDQGSEFMSRDLDLWAYQRGVTLNFSRPGKPTDNAFIESLNGKFRVKCLNAHWFVSLDDARAKCEAWRRDYNNVRPHSTIGNKPPITLLIGQRHTAQLDRDTLEAIQLTGPTMGSSSVAVHRVGFDKPKLGSADRDGAEAWDGSVGAIQTGFAGSAGDELAVAHRVARSLEFHTADIIAIREHSWSMARIEKRAPVQPCEADQLLALASAVGRLSTSHRDPERFYMDRSEIVMELKWLAWPMAAYSKDSQ